ncbi:hypothetical protein SLEP1_g41220 [Rubroshorea leprosula]|uniref:Uncharacterized protein n=1 Tax=Rubroshorea leprosula TaxID=152421 RepID=A0AAV5L5U3_9ROSI|nr:hypothetical protein SLEP1_g41220 [Rubroshorea leprosula]
MSEKAGQHRRRASQTAFVSFDDLSDPVSDNVVDKPTSSSQVLPEQIHVPLQGKTIVKSKVLVKGESLSESW